jgi:arabinan endo-1,5-alpha-L-arabinosidase
MAEEYDLMKTFDGELRLAIHTPNRQPEERPALYRVLEDGNTLRLAAN